MNILILGGTSFFGKLLVNRLVEEGNQVGIMTRGNSQPQDIRPHWKFVGDRYEEQDLSTVAGKQAWDVVIDNLATNRESVEIALKAFKGVGRYLLTSTISVYSFSREGYRVPLLEDQVDHSFHPPSEEGTNIHWKYARGKLEAESTLMDKAP